MAKVRLIDAEPRMVPWLGPTTVQPDQVVEIPDDTFDAYACQPAVWEVVEEPRAEEKPSRTQAVSTGPDISTSGPSQAPAPAPKSAPKKDGE